MGRNCTVCIHPAVKAIDELLETGQTLREIAASYGVSKTALHRHWRAHALSGASLTVEDTGTNAGAKLVKPASTIIKWLVIGVLAAGFVASVSGFRYRR